MRSRAKSLDAGVKNRRTSKKQEQKVVEKLRGATVRATDPWEIAIPETFPLKCGEGAGAKPVGDSCGERRWFKSKPGTDALPNETGKGPPATPEGLRAVRIRAKFRWTLALVRERWAPVRRDRACARDRRGRTTM